MWLYNIMIRKRKTAVLWAALSQAEIPIPTCFLFELPTELISCPPTRYRCCRLFRVTVSCVIGHATEVKGSILLDKAKAPHKAYVGDSILGNDTNLGSGTSLANFKERAGDQYISVKVNGRRYPTGLTKFGAIFGDRAETGCNTECNPGTLVGKDTLLYPCFSARGYYRPQAIVKHHPVQTIVDKSPEGVHMSKTSSTRPTQPASDRDSKLLEKKVKELEKRVAQLEAQLSIEDDEDIKVGGTD